MRELDQQRYALLPPTEKELNERGVKSAWKKAISNAEAQLEHQHSRYVMADSKKVLLFLRSNVFTTGIVRAYSSSQSNIDFFFYSFVHRLLFLRCFQPEE